MISAHLPVQISDEEILKVARQLYGMNGSLQRLPGEYDTNVRIRGVDDTDVVLKIMHPSRAESFVEMQIAALQHISVVAPAVPVQRVVAQRGGQFWSVVTIGTHAHVVWMLTYIEGTLFADANPVDDALVAHLGDTIAHIDSALQHLPFAICVINSSKSNGMCSMRVGFAGTPMRWQMKLNVHLSLNWWIVLNLTMRHIATTYVSD